MKTQRRHSPARRSRRGARAAKVLGILAAALSLWVCIAATAADARPISPSSAIHLPSPSQCVSNRSITVRLGAVAGFRWISVTIRINGTKVTGPRHPHGGQSFTIGSLPKSPFVIEIIANGKGHRLPLTRHFKPCTAPTTPKVPSKPKTPSPPATPTEVKPPSTPVPGASQPGRYEGSDPQNLLNGRVEFFVSPAGNLQDVQVWETKLACTPSKTITSRFELPEVTVGAGGSFSGTSQQEGILEGVPATFTYTVSGSLQEKTASGVFREDVTFNNGTAFSCSTNNQSWNAIRDATQSPLVLPAQPGRYEGNDPQNLLNGRVEFFVSPAGNLQDVQVWETKLACTPSKTITSRFELPEVTVDANGSFSGVGHQNAVVEGSPGSVTYTFSGHVHGAASNGNPRVAGVFREDIAFNNGSAFSCSTNNQSWNASRDATQSPLVLPAQTGHYKGNNPQNLLNGRPEFVVSPVGNLQNVTIIETRLACTPNKTVNSHFELAEVTVAADGSFSGTGHQTAVVEGATANITYTFSGHVHGAGSDGKPRVAGVFREDMTFNNGTSYSCSTNNQSWNASREGA